MFLYSLFFFIYSIINIELKEIKKDKNLFFFSKKNNNITNKNHFFKEIKTEINNELFFLTDKKDYKNTLLYKISKAEEIFREYTLISFPFLFSGIFIILYGAYYYKLSLIIHFAFFSYYNIILFLSDKYLYYTYCLLTGLFSLISGVLISIFIATDDIKSKIYKIQIILYGMICGCFLQKIVFFYINILYIENHFNIEYIDIIYYITLFILTLLFGFINYILPDKLSYMTCSIISGSFYIINILNCAIFTKEKKRKEIFITSIIIHVIIVAFSIFYQIFHLKYKDLEKPPNYKNEKLENDVSRISTASYKSNDDEIKQGKDEKEQELLNNSKNEENDDEEEINDQED